MDFVQNERLGWTDFEAKGKAFEEDGEFVEGFFFLLLPFPYGYIKFVATRSSILIFSYFLILFRCF